MHGGRDVTITAPATDAARQWTGWSTALKPAFEPALLFRKPLVGTVAENVMAHGTGALNIDGCRVETTGRDFVQPHGRWPANVITDGSDEVVEIFPITTSGGGEKHPKQKSTFMASTNRGAYKGTRIGSDTGSAARFFYCAKASKRDRDEGLDGFTNGHLTVKPTTLMQYLIRLVTPPNGVVLDPFNGSGSTGKAAMLEGMRYVGIELLQEYVDISYARIQHALDHSDMYQDDEDDTENKPEKQDDDLK